MSTIEDAKSRLDYIMQGSRVLWYKPIQIAEVLFRSRVVGDITVSDKSTFSIHSKRWRDEITQRLAGRRSTSSSRFQDDVWNDTAMPPSLLSVLDAENKMTNGAVERYIYIRFEANLSVIGEMIAYIENATSTTFDLKMLLSWFEDEPRLRRSVDKAYEIVVYALFSTIVSHLNAKVTLHISPDKVDLLREFGAFAQMVLGVSPENLEITQEARLFRVGVTNAADRGLDMWANFGPAIQVKHITLSTEVAEGASNEVRADKMVLVCKRAEVDKIHSVLAQLGLDEKIRGIITEVDLIDWYHKCFQGHFADELADDLLQSLFNEFAAEFPQALPLAEFFAERKYSDITPPERWQL